MLVAQSHSLRESTLLAYGSPNAVISNDELGELLNEAYSKIRGFNDLLIVPPDLTRPDANAPFLLNHSLQFFHRESKQIVPALGTHHPMNTASIKKFFGENTPLELFAAHRAESDTRRLGTIDAEKVEYLTGGVYKGEFPVDVSKRVDGNRLVLAFSHIIPHEVMGFAGYSKHIIVGLGGVPTIDKSHEIAALFGIDETLGRMNTPSRQLINYAHREYLADKNIVYVMLVRSPASANETACADSHGMITRGVYVGSGDDLFKQAVLLSRQVNLTVVEPLKEAVVYLPEENYHAFWLAMKGCYRMRLAMAEGGTLHVVCPGVRCFGENEPQEDIISRYGYQGWAKLKELYDTTPELRQRSGIWAHLTHGSPPEIAPGVPKFKMIVYPKLGDEGMSEKALSDAHLSYGDHREIMARFSLTESSPMGFVNGIYYGSNPAKGLWLTKSHLEKLD